MPRQKRLHARPHPLRGRKWSRRSLIGTAGGVGIVGLVQLLFPEMASAHAAQYRDWDQQSLTNVLELEERKDFKGETTRARARGNIADGSVVEKVASQQGGVLTITSTLLSGDQAGAQVFERWQVGSETLRLVSATANTDTQTYSTAEVPAAAVWRPCPVGAVPKTSCTAVSKDYWICCGPSHSEALWQQRSCAPAALRRTARVGRPSAVILPERRTPTHVRR